MDITIYQYRSFSLNLVFNTGLSNPFPLTGYTLAFMIKPNTGVADGSAIYGSESPTGNPAFGNMTFTIPAATTGAFPAGSGVYDVAVKSADGTIVSTVLSGNVTISAPVRQNF
jgi:hypothetical protein